jgi:hypothetical protein
MYEIEFLHVLIWWDFGVWLAREIKKALKRFWDL